MLMHQFIELEGNDRGNYTLQEIAEWCIKYGISLFDELIWVTPDPKMATIYAGNMTPFDYDEVTDEMVKAANLVTYELNENMFIIPESDDGCNGVLLVIKNKEEEKCL
jgi:predicted ATP-grasp superfamily ATP-dependent carboligase